MFAKLNNDTAAYAFMTNNSSNETLAVELDEGNLKQVSGGGFWKDAAWIGGTVSSLTGIGGLVKLGLDCRKASIQAKNKGENDYKSETSEEGPGEYDPDWLTNVKNGGIKTTAAADDSEPIFEDLIPLFADLE